MSKDTGGPAFPSGNDVVLGDWRSGGHSGMTLRDYFAAKAMQGILCHRDFDYAPFIDEKVPMLANEAYRVADAMLKAREA